MENPHTYIIHFFPINTCYINIFKLNSFHYPRGLNEVMILLCFQITNFVEKSGKS